MANPLLVARSRPALLDLADEQGTRLEIGRGRRDFYQTEIFTHGRPVPARTSGSHSWRLLAPRSMGPWVPQAPIGGMSLEDLLDLVQQHRAHPSAIWGRWSVEPTTRISVPIPLEPGDVGPQAEPGESAAHRSAELDCRVAVS